MPIGACSALGSRRMSVLACIVSVLVVVVSYTAAGPMCGCEHRSTILMDFFTATNGAQWTNNGGWGTTSPCSTSWVGVTCIDGDVTALALPNNNLQGTLIPLLSSLTSLRQLSLEINAISGTLPASWGLMRNMTNLFLQVNSIGGSLPPSWSSMDSLEMAYLGQNRLTGSLPDSWASMKRLQVLYLAEGSLSGTLPSAWGSMPSLANIYLRLNQIDGTLPSAWANITTWIGLDLSGNRVEGPIPESWAYAKNLRVVRLSSNRLSGSLHDSWGYKNFQTLQLDDNQLSGALPSSWGAMTELMQLALSGNQLTGSLPEAWGSMTSLQQLELENNMLAGTLPEVWARFNAVRYLYVGNNSFHGPLPEAWGANMTKLVGIRVQRNCLYGVVPTTFADIPSLVTMNTCDTNLTGGYALVACSVTPSRWPSRCANIRIDVAPGTRSTTCSGSSLPSTSLSAPRSESRWMVTTTNSIPSMSTSATYSKSRANVWSITPSDIAPSLSDSLMSSLTISTTNISPSCTVPSATPSHPSPTRRSHSVVTSSLDSTTASVPFATVSASTWGCVVHFTAVTVRLVPVVEMHWVASGPTIAMSEEGRGECGPSATGAGALCSVSTAPVERQLLGDAAFLMNVSITEPPSASRWVVRDVLFDEWKLNFSVVTNNMVPWQALTVRPPPERSSWIASGTPLLQSHRIILQLVMVCDGAVVVTVDVAVPLPGVTKDLAGEVVVASRTSQVASALAGGASSGTAVGRTMSIRSMVMCDADAAVGGGVLDLSLRVCGLEGTAGYIERGTPTARSAVISNAVLVSVSGAFLGFLSVAWALYCKTTFAEGMRILSLPSTLLPTSIIVLPSTSAASSLLAARLGSSPCVGTDTALIAAGALLCASPLCVLTWLFWTKTRGPNATWICRPQDDTPQASRNKSAAGFIYRFTEVFRRRWKWVAATEGGDSDTTGITHGASWERRNVWVVLLEYRVLWFAALDGGVLVALAVLTVVGGLFPSVVWCRVCTVLAIVLIVALIGVVAYCQPFTTQFAQVYGLSTLVLTFLSILAQLFFTFVSPSDASGMWLLRVAAVCDLAVVGVTAFRMAFDVRELFRALRRRAALLRDAHHHQEEPPAALLLTLLPDDSSSATDGSDSIVLASSEDTLMEHRPTMLTSDEIELLEQIESDFWDATGAAVSVGAVADHDHEMTDMFGLNVGGR